MYLCWYICLYILHTAYCIIKIVILMYINAYIWLCQKKKSFVFLNVNHQCLFIRVCGTRIKSTTHISYIYIVMLWFYNIHMCLARILFIYFVRRIVAKYFYFSTLFSVLEHCTSFYLCDLALKASTFIHFVYERSQEVTVGWNYIYIFLQCATCALFIRVSHVFMRFCIMHLSAARVCKNKWDVFG